MRTEDLKTLSHLGQALWVDPDYSEKVSVETLAAVSLMDLTEDRSLEKASGALLARAIREGVSANAPALNRPFYRLHPEERFILSALHCGRWSYERIARVLRQPADQIPKLAWNARIHLVSAPGRPVYIPYPTGSSLNGVRCPEYDPSNPWTQRFLDDEMNNRERIFLQNHLMSCERCRNSLSRCRNVYYVADALIPRSNEDTERARIYERALQKSRYLARPSEVGFVDSLKVFAQRRDIQFAMATVFVFVLVNVLL